MRRTLAIATALLYLAAIIASLFVIIKPQASVFYRKMTLDPQFLYPQAGAYTYHYLFDDNTYDPSTVLILEDDKVMPLAYLGYIQQGGAGTYSLKVTGANHAVIVIVPTEQVDPARQAHSYSLYIRPYLFSRAWGSVILVLLLFGSTVFIGYNLVEADRRKVLLSSPLGVAHAWTNLFDQPEPEASTKRGFLRRDAPLIILLAILALSTWMQTSFWQDDATDFDIYYLYRDGQRLLTGENPYARVLASDMRINDKFTTVFPMMVELSYAAQRFVFPKFEPMAWLSLWRLFTLFANLGIIVLLFRTFNNAKGPILSAFVVLFWAFNRWTLAVEGSSGADFLPIFFLLISLLLLPRKPWWGLAFFSLSLSFKQIGIFLLPAYLIYIFQTSQKQPLKRTLWAFLAIISIPLVTSIPFLVWNFKGFVSSILFSATRSQFQFAQPADSLDMVLKLTGLSARIPLLLMLALVYYIAWHYRANLYLVCMLAMAVFVDFNSLFFFQYMPWFILVLLLVVLAVLGPKQEHLLTIPDKRLPT
ncbi:MAG: hypothetical protein HPY76_11225 [Anaerolineae bacterium]|nr:hypothetical protein [Anaerolineae bacterium]